MKTMWNLFVMTILIEVMIAPTTLAVTAEDIVSQLAQREQSIKSIRGKFNVWSQIRMNDGNMMELEKQYEWIKKGNMQKLITEYTSLPKIINPQEPNSPAITNTSIMTEKEIRTFDGQLTRIFLPDSNTAGIHPGDDLFFIGKVPADWLLPRLQAKPLSLYLQKDGTTLKYRGILKLDGRDCHLLEFAASKSNGKLYLTDEQDLVPIRLDINLINYTVPFNTRVEYVFSEVKKYGNINLPSTVLVNAYRVYSNSEERSMTEILTIKELEVNVQIPESDLRIEFPAGTRVHDSIANKVYIVDANSK